ncbi:AMP-binding protein [Blastochloris viridis]|nr:AMP-binding protein [Blastochloris viridis]ALK10092.1 Bifunctional protein Aas [Blastochloris viridis]CUU42756.1 Bifunctional protein aas [Blastochloris viridis]
MVVFRFVMRLLLRAVFRLKIVGRDHLTSTAAQPRLYVIAHDSWLDPLIGYVLLGRDALHVLPAAAAAKWYLRWMLPRGIAVLAPTDNREAVKLRRLAADRHTVVVYAPNGAVIEGDELQAVQDIAVLADRIGAEVVLMRLGGLERSPATLHAETAMRRRWLPKVTVTVEAPRRLDLGNTLGKTRRIAAGRALYLALSDLRFRTADTNRTLFGALRGAADRYGSGHPALSDSMGAAFSYRTLQIGALVLGRLLARRLWPGETVGVLLPNAAGTAVTYFALQSVGRVPAMLNYTAGAANIIIACRSAQVRLVLSSRAFVERAQLQPLIAALQTETTIIWLEDIRAKVGRLQKLRGVLSYLFWRPRGKPDDPATVVFTSGSEGSPKGVVLSHRNILNNSAQVASRIAFGPEDKLLSVLPVFHSLGLTAGMVLPLVAGVKLHFYPSPLHYKQVPEQLVATKATIFFATDTFLAGYARNASPEAFSSVRLIVSGAEPVRADTRRVYRERFGLQLLEGYGMTEMAPVVAVNTPMFNRDGTVGPLLPLIEIRMEPVPGLEGGGRLWLKGPNMMLGYLSSDRPGVLEPPHDGWHDSGDVVEIDADGYVAIRGRVKRFAKIAGEMISLNAVEAMVAELWPEDSHAVVAVPDPRRGERVVLLTTRIAARRGDVAAYGRNRGASDLMVPSDVIVIDQVPLLGSGKTDHVAARRLACARMSA